MQNDLFFVPMITHALQQPDPKAAMLEVFEEIRRMGRESRHARGYEQFLQFMESVDKARLQETPEELGAEILAAMERPSGIEIIIERNDEVTATCSFEQPSGTRSVDGIAPGDYRVKLDTGRVLWEGCLAERDLLWSKAFPGEPLKMAADSGQPIGNPTREISLLEGTVILRVFAGVESGFMEIELKPSEPQG